MYNEFSKYFGESQKLPGTESKDTSMYSVKQTTSLKQRPVPVTKTSGVLTKRPKLNLRSKGIGSQDASMCLDSDAHGSPKIKISSEAIPEKSFKTKQTPFFPDKFVTSVNRSLSPGFQFAAPRKKTQPSTFKLGEDRKVSLTGICSQLKGSVAEKSKINIVSSKASLIERGGAEGGRELIDAVKSQNFENILNILSREEDLYHLVNSRGENSWTPMHFACWLGNLNLVNLLYYNQADLNATGRDGVTPVMVCCLKGNLKLLKHLITLRVALDQTDEHGNNLLHYAAKSGSLECLEALLDTYKLDVLHKNSDGKAPIDLAKLREIKTALIQASNRDTEINEARFIQISSVKNENFFQLDSNKKLIGTMETDSTSRSRELEEVGPKDFVIHAQIGRGSFGEVYLVERKTTGMLYAMKVLYKNKIIRKLES